MRDKNWQNSIIYLKALHSATNKRSIPFELLRPMLSHWNKALETNRPDLDPINFGFEADNTSKVMIPRLLPPGVETAADFVLNLINVMRVKPTL